MAALEPLMSLTCFGERIGRHDHRTDFALIDKPTDLGELSGIGLGSITDTVRLMQHRLFSRGLAECGDENTTWLQHPPGPLLGLCADEVQGALNIDPEL